MMRLIEKYQTALLGLIIASSAAKAAANKADEESAARAKKTLYFKLELNKSCPSSYAADNLLTSRIEHTCVAFDLNGRQGSAFQGGVMIYPLENGEVREVWPVFDIWFSLDPRELPNPAVSPLIYFQFIRDQSCPSAYAARLLDFPLNRTACLEFDLSGIQGKATVAASNQREWLLKDLNFRVPSN